MSPAAPGTVRGDELSDAKAKQAQLKKDIAAQKAMVAQLNALQIDLAAGIRQTTDQLKGINADLAAVKVKISGMQAKINVIKKDYAALVAQLADARRAARPDHRQGSGQAHRAGRAEGAAGRPAAQRLRHGPDVAPRVIPVGRHVHRPAGRDELLHRRRRAGQGARQPDRRRPGDARRDPPDDDRHAHPDRRPAPPDGRPEARPRPQPRRSSTRPRPRSGSSRSGSRPSSRSRSATT